MRRELVKGFIVISDYRLNPCFSGICAASDYLINDENNSAGLNPCFSGICAARGLNGEKLTPVYVLILVLVEYAPRVFVKPQTKEFTLS